MYNTNTILIDIYDMNTIKLLKLSHQAFSFTEKTCLYMF